MHAIYNDGSDAEVKVAPAIAPSRAMSNDLWDGGGPDPRDQPKPVVQARVVLHLTGLFLNFCG
jgi:hypothetical protein